MSQVTASPSLQAGIAGFPYVIVIGTSVFGLSCMSNLIVATAT